MNNTSVDCREWHYRGGLPAAPGILLVEAIMGAMLNIDEIPPVVSALRNCRKTCNGISITRKTAVSTCCT
jgi:hypothetical protein